MHMTASSPAPRNLGQAVAVLLLAAVGTALILGIDVLLPNVALSGIQQNAVRLTVLALILYGAWIGLPRAGFAGRQRLMVWLAISVPVLGWQSLVWWLAAAGAFQAHVALLPLAIVVPLLIGLPVLLRTTTIGLLLDVTPPAWLVGLQVYRVVGSVFVAGWLVGSLPAIVALPAGLGDTLVGLLALPVALALQSGVRGARGLAVGWNLLGILDLVDAITLNALTTAGSLQLIAPGGVDPASTYPLVLIPAFGVPLSLVLHALSLRQLRRAARRQTLPPSSVHTSVTAYA